RRAAAAATSTATATAAQPCPSVRRIGRRRTPAVALFLFGRGLVAVGGGRGLLGRHRHLLGRDLARDEGDVDLVARLAVVGARASDEDRRARLELASENEVCERILDVALDRAAQRPRAHRRVVALVDKKLLRIVGELDRDLV